MKKYLFPEKNEQYIFNDEIYKYHVFEELNKKNYFISGGVVNNFSIDILNTDNKYKFIFVALSERKRCYFNFTVD